MAIISFALTTKELLSGDKTVTRRMWKRRQTERWQRFWDDGKFLHEAWDKVPFAGGVKIGEILLMQRPYIERLADMPVSDLVAEGGMCSTLDGFYKFIGLCPDDEVTVIRFKLKRGGRR